MAKQTIVQLIDDLSGESIDDGAGRTVQFAFDGTSYEIDLSLANIAQFEQAVQPYVSAARKVTGGKRGSTAKSSNNDVAAIRQWAKDNGFEISSRGRVPANVLEAYSRR